MSSSGKWHVGILRQSSKYPLGGEPKKYPPNFFKPLAPSSSSVASGTASSTLPPSSPTAKAPSDKPLDRVTGTGEATTETSSGTNVTLLEARSGREAKKPNQMTFSKGDLVELVDGSGKWHVGILRSSKTHVITGEKKYFPPNYFKPHTAAGAVTEVIMSRATTKS